MNLAKSPGEDLCKIPPFGINKNVEITVGVLENLSLADLLLSNDLFNANPKLRDPIGIVHFDGSPSPVMDKAIPNEQVSECVELVTSGDQMAETGVTVVEYEMMAPSSDLIEIAAVTRSHSKQESDVDDGNTGSVTLSDEKNRMLRDMGYDQI